VPVNRQESVLDEGTKTGAGCGFNLPTSVCSDTYALAAFATGFETGKAGTAVGSRAVVKASNRAIDPLGASEGFSLLKFRLSNMIFLRPEARLISARNRGRATALEPG
jgi:hypothetical protein